jgi:hypothetical protein
MPEGPGVPGVFELHIDVLLVNQGHLIVDQKLAVSLGLLLRYEGVVHDVGQLLRRGLPLNADEAGVLGFCAHCGQFFSPNSLQAAVMSRMPNNAGITSRFMTELLLG